MLFRSWNAPRVLMPKNKVKLVLNLCLIAQAAIPRGGEIIVTILGDDGASLRVEAKGPNAKLAHHVPALVAATPENGTVDAHGIQPFYTGLVARESGMGVNINVSADQVTIVAQAA